MQTWIDGLPKVELHVHVEGAIKPETLMHLARKNDVTLPATTLEDFRDWYEFRDFPHFADVYQTLSRSIRDADDLHHIVTDFLAEQARQNILHTEATFTALTHYRNTGMSFAAQMDAIRDAAVAARAKHGVSLGLIIDIPRELSTLEEAAMVAGWVAEAHGDGLVYALGLGGYEPGFPPEMFTDAFAIAREAGVPAVVHGGETGTHESVRGAVETLGAVRVGHGVAAIHDAATISMLVERGIPLEVCPGSNVCLKVAPSYESHPFRQLWEADVTVTINTDDPPIFNTDLNREYFELARAQGFTESDLRNFALTAAEAALCGPERKSEIMAEIEGYAVSESVS